ncbi:MAG TPA: selenide, water dikinase SelD [Candidatus Binatia bacterium]|nr:selenide, water dikinase SelD [Candidatus Binatia bacterium]
MTDAAGRFRLTARARAAGCAGKLGPADLSALLRGLPQAAHPDLLVGTDTADDAGVFRIGPDLALVQTVDFFQPIVDDAYTFGAIAAANALSDVYAMGGEPRTALNIACFPSSGVPHEILADILRGGLAKAAEAGVVVLGGHTVADDELKFGMAVTGVVHPDRVWRNVGAQAGDALLLTKPLGTGIVATAIKREAGEAAEHAAAIASMAALNRDAARALRDAAVHACTDVTGFSLLGHGWEMAHGSGVRLVFEAERLPLLPGARALAARGFLTGGCRRNRDWLAGEVRVAAHVPADLVEIAFDPQTSGGLLVAVPAGDAPDALARLRAAGAAAATAVGFVEPLGGGPAVALR